MLLEKIIEAAKTLKNTRQNTFYNYWWTMVFRYSFSFKSKIIWLKEENLIPRKKSLDWTWKAKIHTSGSCLTF